MKKKVKPIMLPTDDISSVSLGNSGKGFMYHDILRPNYDKRKYQHIHFTSDEEIKEGDWAYSMTGNLVYQFALDNNKDPYTKKVIATTDKSLKIKGLKENCKCLSNPISPTAKCESCLIGISLPQIPESFIKHFVEKNGKIDEVELEYENKCKNEWRLRCTAQYERTSDCCLKLKTTESNEVIISLPEEKMYSLNEMKNIHVSVMKQGCLYEGGSWTDEHERLVKLEFDKWIKENL